MANGGGNFGGDGSVVWEVSTNMDRKRDSKGEKRKKIEEDHNGDEGRTNGGIDADVGEYFVILLVPPAGKTPQEFIEDRTLVEPFGNHVRIRLKIANIPKQIEIHWTSEYAGTTGSTNATT